MPELRDRQLRQTYDTEELAIAVFNGRIETCMYCGQRQRGRCTPTTFIAPDKKCGDLMTVVVTNCELADTPVCIAKPAGLPC